jgi:hypothetical protein
VLSEIFSVPFDEIGTIVERSPQGARQLASGARRRVRGGALEPDGDVSAQREVVDAFLAAAREGDFERLVAVRTRRDHRYQQPRLRSLGEILGDAMVGAALIDRLVYHARTITLKANSSRLRERAVANSNKPRRRARPTELS